MKLTKLAGAAILAASLTAATAAPAAAQPAAGQPAARSCFFPTQWRGWSSPSPDILYLRVNRDVFRVDLVGSSGRLKTPGRFLVTKSRGAGPVCSAIDLDLSVADQGGFRTPLFPKALTKLSREEAAAIPRQYQP
jgi:hypothetical protein